MDWLARIQQGAENNGPKWEKWQEEGEDCIMRSFVTYTLHRILLGDQIKKDEIGRTCSMHGRDEECTQYFSWKT
jgi:hypothetical protein